MQDENSHSVFENYPIPIVPQQLELLDWRKVRGRPRGSKDFKVSLKRLDIYGAKGKELRGSILWWNTRLRRFKKSYSDDIPEVMEVEHD